MDRPKLSVELDELAPDVGPVGLTVAELPLEVQLPRLARGGLLGLALIRGFVDQRQVRPPQLLNGHPVGERDALPRIVLAGDVHAGRGLGDGDRLLDLGPSDRVRFAGGPRDQRNHKDRDNHQQVDGDDLEGSWLELVDSAPEVLTMAVHPPTAGADTAQNPVPGVGDAVDRPLGVDADGRAVVGVGRLRFGFQLGFWPGFLVDEGAVVGTAAVFEIVFAALMVGVVVLDVGIFGARRAFFNVEPFAFGGDEVVVFFGVEGRDRFEFGIEKMGVLIHGILLWMFWVGGQ